MSLSVSRSLGDNQESGQADKSGEEEAWWGAVAPEMHVGPPDRKGVWDMIRWAVLWCDANSALSGGFGVVLTGPWSWIKR